MIVTCRDKVVLYLQFKYAKAAMSYSNVKRIRPFYGHQKKISSITLNIGDRFIYKDERGLLFKIGLPPVDNKYACCNERGIIFWIDADEQVIRINGIAGEMLSISQYFKMEYCQTVKSKNE